MTLESVSMKLSLLSNNLLHSSKQLLQHQLQQRNQHLHQNLLRHKKLLKKSTRA